MCVFGWFFFAAFCMSRAIPDSSDLLVAADTGVWRAGLSGDTWRRIADRGGLISVSPDGRPLTVAFGRGALSVLTTDGATAHEVVGPQPGVTVSRAVWAPDGSRVAYRSTVSEPGKPQRVEIVLRRPDGSDAVHIPMLRGARFLAWADGRILFGAHSRDNPRDDELWTIDVDRTTGRATGEPVQLPISPGINIIQPVLTRDLSRLVFSARRLISQVVVADFDPVRRVLGEVSQKAFTSRFDQPIAWLPAGDELLFMTSAGRGVDLARAGALRDRLRQRLSRGRESRLGRPAPRIDCRRSCQRRGTEAPCGGGPGMALDGVARWLPNRVHR